MTLRKCREAIAKSAAAFAQARIVALQRCRAKILRGKLIGLCPADDPKTSGSLSKAAQQLRARIGKACGGKNKVCGAAELGADADVPRADIGFPATCPGFEGSCKNPIADRNCGDVSACLECIGEAAGDEAIALYYDLSPADPKAEKSLNACQQAIGTSAAKFFVAKSKALLRCWNKVSRGKLAGPCPDAAKAQPAIAKAAARKDAAIAKACCGENKTCNLADRGVDADFEPAADLGFRQTCDDVTVPRGMPCGGTITEMQSLIACVDCVTQFKVDCIDAARVPAWVTPYPAECE